MISSWRKAGSRLGAMSWHELRTRVRQAFNMRLDSLRYQTAFPKYRAISSIAGGRFFFSTDDLAERTALLRAHLGEQVANIVQQAEDACAHRFRLLGYENLDYGADIDWHLDPVSGKRAPLKPWYKIPFLDYNAVGDHKVVWELNRHQHLVTLAKAWLLSSEQKYVRELIRQWYGWQKVNPFPLGINWASSLEVAFRSLSWLWVRFLLTRCPAVPATFDRNLLEALALNGRHIERYLSTYYSPNTHLLGEATALFFIGTLCPQLGRAERWQTSGWQILLQEAERQVLDDGVHFERSLYYHVYALDFFLHARLLAACNGIEPPHRFDAILRKMLEVLRTLCQASPPHSFGDDDGGRLFDATRNRCEHLADPITIGALLFGSRELIHVASLTEEAVWLFGQRASSLCTGSRDVSRLNTAVFPAAGIYVIASSEASVSQMVIDAGPHGAGRAGHGHADGLSLVLSFAGRQWLVDRGTFTYSEGNERCRFRGTRAHNTVTVDDFDQAEPDGPFAWQFLPDVRAERWLVGETFTLFSGSHMGYCRLQDPVLHRRVVFHLPGRFWFVRDLLDGRERHQIEVTWQFAPDLSVQETDTAFVAYATGSTTEEALAMALIPVDDRVWSSKLDRDTVSRAYGAKQAAPVVRTSADVQLPAECAVLIMPLHPSAEQPGTLSSVARSNADSSGVRGYCYHEDRNQHYLFFSPVQRPWTLGPWTSDATFVYCRVRDGDWLHFVVCEGSFARSFGKMLFSHCQRVERFEWRNLAGQEQVFSSDDSAAESFSQELLQHL